MCLAQVPPWALCLQGGWGRGAAPVYTRGCDGEQDLTGALFLAFAAMHSRDLDKEDLHVIITCE